MAVGIGRELALIRDPSDGMVALDRAAALEPLHPPMYDLGVAEALAFTTPEVFLAGEQASQQRHELVSGRVYALAGGSDRHNALALLIYELIGPVARSRGCRARAFDRLLRTSNGNFYYPDLMVLFSPSTRDRYETDPTMIVEVLSPSTQHSDRREKASLYAESPSLELLLLADQNGRRIEVARIRDARIQGWQAYGPGEFVPTPYGDIVIDALFDLLDQTAGLD
jgi:Uma2 family endonuclease